MKNIPDYWQRNVAGQALTSMRCGGIVMFLALPQTLEQLHETLSLAVASDIPYRMIGGGSNLILPDQGYAGVLIRPQFRQLRMLLTNGLNQELERMSTANSEQQRYRSSGGGYLQLESEPIVDGPLRLFEAGCDVSWGQLVQFSLKNRLHGLHRYARIPCKVGGAVCNNIHAAEHLLQEAVCYVEAMDLTSGEVVRYAGEALEFGYDSSRFQRTGEPILAVTFALPEVSAAQSTADAAFYRDWTARKAAVQPSGANCGSVFKNLSPESGLENLAAGYYVEACGFKGRRVGGMEVYPGHANFIVNVGNGTQADLLALIFEIIEAVQARFGFRLEPEVECLNQIGQTIQWEQSVTS